MRPPRRSGRRQISHPGIYSPVWDSFVGVQSPKSAVPFLKTYSRRPPFWEATAVEIDLDFRLCPCPIPGKKKTQINFRAQLTNQLPPMEGLGGLLFLNNK